ncbi:MAG: DALR domain-containing protein, partial [Bacteroidales bacterium]|nr:DALR domain-containing protein [Bacteroidales bacterium]
LEKAYSPMVIRYFVLQASYRGTVDFSNEALQSAEKGLEKLYDAERHLDNLKESSTSSENVEAFRERCYEAMNDDFNTPKVIAELFDAVRIINSVKDGHATLTAQDIDLLKTTFRTFFFDILGIKSEFAQGDTREHDALGKAMDLILDIRKTAKTEKNWAMSDKIRDELNAAGIVVKDTKDGAEWSLA